MQPNDSTKKQTNPRRPTYQTNDRYGDSYNNPTNKSPLELKDPDNIKQDVELDTATGNYIVREKVGDLEYRPQTYLSFEEFYKYKNKQMLREYWQKKGTDPMATDPKQIKPNQPFGFTKHIKGLEGPFGSNYVDIKPNGLVTLDFAGRWQRLNNPTIPVRQQRNGLFDFEQQISMNVVGKIGEKLKLTVNWDTKAAFEFQNTVKVQYTAFEEDIIQGIEVGRINMPLNSSLMTGPQNLFGAKAKLQFGRMTVTAVGARQDGTMDEIVLGGGGMGRTFEIRADGYEDYRHFFLGQFFKNNYAKSLASSPTILSGVQVTRVDVYVTNRNNTTANLRDVVGYLDLGEPKPYRPSLASTQPLDSPATNAANKVYDLVANTNKEFRDPQTFSTNLAIDPVGSVMQNGTDYAYLKSARKLAPTEFTFNAMLGYITLQTKLTLDQTLLVAYEYSYNGSTYKVGELTEDITNLAVTDLIIAKMIKPPVVNTHLPTWGLMLKNIYQLGVTNLVSTNFQFRIIYKDDATGADIPNLQEGTNTKNRPLLQLLGLDKLDPNNNPGPDGNFDYVEGVTVDSKNGRIFFPDLEPFGSKLNSYFIFPSEATLITKYVYSELYDSTMSDAQQIANKDKYYFTGRYLAGTSSDIILPGINIAQGSVTVIAGSNKLTEGTDYTVDYNLGRVKILNDGVLSSGQEIRIRFEKQALFNNTRKTFLATRFDYKLNKNVLLGATMLHSNEAPSITRVNIGSEPAANTIIGMDANVKQDSRLLTRAVDLLPIISTKAASSVNFQGEGALFLPGYNKIIDKNGGGGGVAFIDDFEGAETPYDLTRTSSNWDIAATPQRFPESVKQDLSFSYRRARLAWYNIDNIFYRSGNGLPSYITYDKINNHFERNITQVELFPGQDVNVAVTNITTLDLAFYPSERGSYNYNPTLNSDGTLTNPSGNWGGMTRAITNNIDFDAANIQYIEFWMLCPYMPQANVNNTLIDGKPFNQLNTGTLYFNLGSISEDVLPDGLQSFENGLPVSGDPTLLATTTTKSTWGRISNQQFITNAFDNTTAGSRSFQDIGLDGLNNADEQSFFSAFTSAINNSATLSATAKANILDDVSADDFTYYLGGTQDQEELTILERYKNYNRVQNNSPLNSGASITPSSTSFPDNEDVNADNTINTVEDYYEYKVAIDPKKMVIGQNYIVSSNVATVSLPNGTNTDKVTWYQFRIPIRSPDSTIGNIQGYKSIKWMRTYMSGFSTPIVLRLAEFQLVANQWRVYQPDDLNQTGLSIGAEPDPCVLDESTVNIQENSTSNGNTTPYVLPPGFNRDYNPTSTVTVRLNEQSLRLCINNMQSGTARAVYKNVTLNLMNYTKIDMFLHAETTQTLQDGSAVAFLRLGTDYTANYYEIQVPLYFTRPINTTDPNTVWMSQNQIEVNIQDIIGTKVKRNEAQPNNLSTPYSYTMPNGQKIVVVGNPDMSAVVTIMIGMLNPITSSNKSPISFCIWADELRTSGFIDHSAYAYAGKLNLKLADLATVNSSVMFTSAGFGSLDQSISQRQRSNTLQYGVSTNVSLDKFLPAKLGIKLPMYIGVNSKIISPQYDPLNPDVSLAQSVYSQENPSAYKKLVLDNTTQRAINFTNIQKVKLKPNAKKHIYDIENLTLSLLYSETKETNVNLKIYDYLNYHGGLGYSFNNAAKNFQPFGKMPHHHSPLNQLIKELNVALMPSQLTFRTDVDRKLTTTQYYVSGPFSGVQTALYQKSFTITRNYGFLWNFTKSITGTYKALAYAVVDEPRRAPGGAEYTDSVLSNFKRMGRLQNFNQTVSLNYKLPLDKIKILNWTNMEYTYSAGYTWTSGALIQKDTLGSAIQNNRTNAVNAKVDLEKLYYKSKFLLAASNPTPKLKGPPIKNPNDTLPPKPEYRGLKAALRILMMAKNANLSYSSTQGTQMYGFLPDPKYLGFSSTQDMGTMLPFLIGSQDPTFRYKAAADGWISHCRSLNTPYVQTNTQTVTAILNIEPIKGFNIKLDAQIKSGSNYSELFRVSEYSNQTYVSDNPVRSGNYSISDIAIFSSFDKHVHGSTDPNSSANFDRFRSYTNIMINRQGGPGGKYDTSSQSVLIPAFLAAYTGSNPNKISLSSFPTIPLPNWNITYAGLTNILFIKEKFQSLTLSHAYTSLYTVGSYTSSLQYGSQYIQPGPNFTETPKVPDSINSSGKIVPIYVISGVTLQESFAPLIGFNAITKSKISFKLSYGRTRMLNLSLTNSQLTENITNNVQLGIGFVKSNLAVPKFLTRGKKLNLKNELNCQLNMTINDMVTYQRSLSENATVTAGNTNFQLKPTVSYKITQRVTMMVYFERTINSPKISSSYRRATTAFGVQLRFTLS